MLLMSFFTITHVCSTLSKCRKRLIVVKAQSKLEWIYNYTLEISCLLAIVLKICFWLMYFSFQRD